MDKANKQKDSILNALEKMKAFNLVVSDDSVNLGKEFDRYTYEDIGGKALDHGIDAVRYYFMERVNFRGV